MKKFSTTVCGLAVALSMSGCVYAGAPYEARGGYVQTGVYDGYYDGYYGAYPGGYWASDGFFYYRGHANNYHRDDSRHFRREQFHGGAGFRAEHHDNGHYNQNNRNYGHNASHNRSGQGGSHRSWN